ncbi:hypothetical protein [Medusavirus stheno T3]|uniref:Uncharacterized protein n=1 Tax=Medusavirus stheno T3 TaxID=3069717 RepID=A0A7S7YEL1_9VIRU|nr:hypothetical protein QKU73_gp417 [Acanthamoeba castellanii medusavirus]QPB44358.1 hypothetical protein [Medusavirus stheno T3]
MNFTPCDQLRPVASRAQAQRIEDKLQKTAASGLCSMSFTRLFPEVEDQLVEAGYSVRWKRDEVSISMVAPDEEEDWGPRCVRCKCQTDTDPSATDGAMPAYMNGLCTACFERAYSTNDV